MAQRKTVFEFIKFSMKSRTWKNSQDFPRLVSVRCYSDEPKDIEKKKSHKLPKLVDPSLFLPEITFWSERLAIKKVKKENRVWRTVNNLVDLARAVQLTQKFPGNSLRELIFTLKQRVERKILLEQQFLPERHQHLKPDLAAAHFLIAKGGSVKFVGRSEWVSRSKNVTSLPAYYIPGYCIEKINAEGTNLYFEGLPNLVSLKHLKSLSLKGNKEMNDWCMDWISREFYKTLEHLDISDCKGVTHRSLSCFYRFEQLKILEVNGVSDTPEFKLACLQLQDIIPELEIKGIDLSIPDKIDPVNVEEIKNISSS